MQAAREAGGFRLDFEGCEELDLVLRVTRGVEASRIVHVPHVLYHQRSGAPRHGWPAAGDAVSSGIAARTVSDHLMTSGVAADVEVGPRGVVRVRYQLPEPGPPVRVIVPTTMGPESTTCLQGLLERTYYDALSVTVAVADADLDDASQSRLARFSSDPRVDVFVYPTQPFNYSGVNNAAIARGEPTPIICLLNDDVEVIEPRWLKTMVGQVLQPGVGAVGARLLYPDGRVQHAGVMLGVLGVAAPAHQTLAGEDAGYQGRAVADQDLSCVTAACLVIRSDAFDGGGWLRRATRDRVQRRGSVHSAEGARLASRACRGSRALPRGVGLVGLPQANHRSEQFVASAA